MTASSSSSGWDGTHSADGILYIKLLLYQMKVLHRAVDSDPAGSSGISIFLRKLHFPDPY
jgi:hypothetical protein